jgi:head-tail adaptor
VEPLAGQLREAVRFERRAAADDGYGNTQGAWENLIARRAAKLTPTRGGEQVIADRLQGQSSWDLWVRFDSETSRVTTDDRAVELVNGAPGRTFNIAFAQDMTGLRRWILMQLTLGKADG